MPAPPIQYVFYSVWQLDTYSLIDPASLIRNLTLTGDSADEEIIQQFLGKANSFTTHSGRRYSEGYVLATGAVLNPILGGILPASRELLIGGSYDDPTWQLTISNLFIESAVALTPAVLSAGVDEEGKPLAPTDLTPETVYLVHLVDRRYFGDWTSLDDRGFNWRNADGEVIGSSETTYEELLTMIWNAGLQDLLGDLIFIGAPQATTVQQYRFLGESAWEAFHRVLEDAGCILVPNYQHTAYTVYSASDMTGLEEADQTRFDTAKLACLLDTEGTLNGPTIPETVRVYYHVTGQQYQAGETGQEETPQDFWETTPARYKDFDAQTVLNGYMEEDPILEAKLWSSIIPYTTASLWTPIVVYRDESNGFLPPYTSQEEVDLDLELAGTEYLYAKWTTGQEFTWTFSGTWFLPLCDVFSESTVYDYGDGIKSFYRARQTAPRIPQREYPGPPDIHRRRTPYARLAYGWLRDPYGETPLPAKDEEVEEEPGEMLEEGSTGKLVILYTRGGKWYSTGHEVDIYAFRKNTLQAGCFYHAHYNYQAGTYGQWYPFTGTGGGGDNIVAVTEEIIHGRVGDTPGGDGTGKPVYMQRKVLDDPTLEPPTFIDYGPPIPVWSWVKADSSDPADEVGGKLWVFLEQDVNGVYWFTGQDCPPATEI